MEVCDGIKDHCVRNLHDPADTRWEYTYHQRLFQYTAPTLPPVDQIEQLCQKLAAAPHTRRAQAITWKVWEDNYCYDPACLQSIWCRITVENECPLLSMNVRFRSNDAYKAAFMNMFALTHLQSRIAARIGELSGRPVEAGTLLPYCRQFSHLRLEPARVRVAVLGRDPEAHVRGANDALRRRARDHGSGPAGDFGEGAADGADAVVPSPFGRGLR